MNRIHRPLEHFTIKVEPDGDNVAALFGAEQVSRTANFQIAHGNFKSGAEFRVLLDGRYALAGRADGHQLSWQEKVGVRLVAGTSDAPAKLIEVGQSESIRSVDDDGIRIGDIEAAFDNRCRDEDVGLAFCEAFHHGLEFLFLHLPVADGDAGVFDEFADAIGHALDGLDAVV